MKSRLLHAFVLNLYRRDYLLSVHALFVLSVKKWSFKSPKVRKNYLSYFTLLPGDLISFVLVKHVSGLKTVETVLI